MRTNARWLCLAAGLVFACAGALAQPPRRLALVGGMLITGEPVPPVHHGAVLIEGDRIAAAGPESEIKIPPGTLTVDTSGQTMLPGLINAHTHLWVVGDGSYERWYRWVQGHSKDYPMSRILAISSWQELMSGVTSAIDLGGPLQASLANRDRIDRGEIAGPRLEVAGRWIARCSFAGWPFAFQISTPEEAAQDVDKLADAGVDAIKAWACLTAADYKAIVAEAHKRGLKVHAHVYSEEAVRDAFEAGADVLQHVGSAGTAPYSADLVQAIAAASRPIVPTVYHRSWLYPETIHFPERLQDPELKQTFPPDLYDEVEDSLANWWTLPYFGTVRRQMFYRDRSLTQWIKAGAVMGMGVDDASPGDFHTDAMWREIKIFADRMGAMNAIENATRINGRILAKRGAQPNAGAIEPGMLADIIVVDGNPLFDIVNLSHVEDVIKGGVIYKENGKAVAANPAMTSGSWKKIVASEPAGAAETHER